MGRKVSSKSQSCRKSRTAELAFNRLDRRILALQGGDDVAHVKAKLGRQPLKTPEEGSKLAPFRLSESGVELPPPVNR